MAMPFYEDIGFTKTQVGIISKGYGLWVSIIGAGAGAVAVVRYGLASSSVSCTNPDHTCPCGSLESSKLNPRAPQFV